MTDISDDEVAKRFECFAVERSLDLEWDAGRNCYTSLHTHDAWGAWRESYAAGYADAQPIAAIPREPTPRMTLATVGLDLPTDIAEAHEMIWRAMYDAAPRAAQQPAKPLIEGGFKHITPAQAYGQPPRDDERSEGFADAGQAGLVSRLCAAGYDERLSTGALYLEAASRITALEHRLAHVQESRNLGWERAEAAERELATARESVTRIDAAYTRESDRADNILRDFAAAERRVAELWALLEATHDYVRRAGAAQLVREIDAAIAGKADASTPAKP